MTPLSGPGCVHVRAFTGGVLVGVHGRDDIVAGRQGGGLAQAAEGDAGPVRSVNGGVGQGDHQPECDVAGGSATL